MQSPMGGSMHPNEDDAMTGVDDNSSTTPIAGQNIGYQTASHQADTYQGSGGPFSPSLESDPNTRYPSSNSGYQQQQQQPQPYSRPSSGLSGSGQHGAGQTYQNQNQGQGHGQYDASGRPQNSVVLKVGMVGDAQIGKTSLMVKYVEGSWDEDYIQTLGMPPRLQSREGG